jgi:hypothetical protein
MPLIKCPDCGREVSDTMLMCPKCGQPILAPPSPLVLAPQAPLPPRTSTVAQNRSTTRLAIGGLIVLIVVFVLFSVVPFITAFIKPSIVKSREDSQRAACLANLKTIDQAKATWAQEKRKSNQDTPSDFDLFGPGLYIETKPLCPAGGTYSIHAVGRKQTCTIAGHTR